jgi:hypothetical protein
VLSPQLYSSCRPFSLLHACPHSQSWQERLEWCSLYCAAFRQAVEGLMEEESRPMELVCVCNTHCAHMPGRHWFTVLFTVLIEVGHIVLYCIYCIVLLHRVLLHFALLHIVLSRGGARNYVGHYHTVSTCIFERQMTSDNHQTSRSPFMNMCNLLRSR